MRMSFLSAWPMYIGQKPYAREFGVRHGADFLVHVMQRNAWLRVRLRVCGCVVMHVAVGHDVPEAWARNRIRQDAYYCTIGLAGFFVTWRSREQEL
jgi:hypothetical protein